VKAAGRANSTAVLRGIHPHDFIRRENGQRADITLSITLKNRRVRTDAQRQLSTATTVKPGFLHSMRKANRTSCRIHPTTARARIVKSFERALHCRKIAALATRASSSVTLLRANVPLHFVCGLLLRAEISAQPPVGEKMRLET